MVTVLGLSLRGAELFSAAGCRALANFLPGIPDTWSTLFRVYHGLDQVKAKMERHYIFEKEEEEEEEECTDCRRD